MIKKLLLPCALYFSGVSFVYADVVSEYREADSDGFIAVTHLSQQEDGVKQRGIESFGEYDLTDYMTLTARYTNGYVDQLEEPDTDLHIASAGVRFNWPVGEDFNIGFKTNIVDRDLNEVDGISYRFMPIVQWNPAEFLHFRYIYEFDFIPESSRARNDETGLRPSGNEAEQETALYVRLMGKGMEDFLPSLLQPLSYEVKIATGIGDTRPEGKSKWNLSYEHHIFWDFAEDFKLKYAIVQQDGDTGLQTVGMSYKF